MSQGLSVSARDSDHRVVEIGLLVAEDRLCLCLNGEHEHA